MPRRRLLLLTLAALAAAAAGAVAVVLGSRGSAEARVPRQPVVVAGASLVPRVHAFGDPVVARVDLVVDRKRVDPDEIAFLPRFAPYRQAGELEISRSDIGRVTRLRYEVPLSCLSLECVPESVPALKITKSFRLPPARLVYRADGRRRVATAPWPELDLVTRMTPRELPVAGQPFGPAVEAFPELGKPSYRVSATLARGGLLALALLLLAAAVALLLPYVRRAPAPPPPEPEPERRALSPLERAVAGLEWARAHGEPREQRQALELLTEELELIDAADLAEEARALAWSPQPPTEDAMKSLAERALDLVEAEDDAARV